MTAAFKPRIVPPLPKEPVSIDQMWRDDIRKRDWGKVHIEADKREPVLISALRWVHRL